jgi:Tfp pilus assembly protein FimT
VFTGNTAGGPPDGDGNPLTITGDGQPYYDSGTATFISNLTADDVGDISSLDELMQYSFYADGDSTGSAVGTATVPAPLTMIALTMSMGALGGYLRKRGGG